MKIAKLNSLSLLFLIITPFLFVIGSVREMNYNVYFLVMGIILFPLFIVNFFHCGKCTNSIIIKKSDTFSLSLALLLLVILNSNSNQFIFSAYIISLFIVILFFSVTDFKISIKYPGIYILIIFLYFIVSLVFAAAGKYYGLSPSGVYRYQGLFLSSTVMGIMSLSLYVLFLKLNKSRFLLILIYLILLFILFKGDSRLDIMLGIILPLYFSSTLKKIYIKHPLSYFLIILISFLIFYLGYEYLKSYLMLGKMRVGSMDSDRTRFIYSIEVFNSIIHSDLLHLLIGHGANSSFLIIGNFGVKPHNDFLRIIYDYGLLFFVLFIVLVYKWYKTNHLNSFLIIVYFASFYHNMVFAFYLVLLILLNVKLEVKAQEQPVVSDLKIIKT